MGADFTREARLRMKKVKVRKMYQGSLTGDTEQACPSYHLVTHLPHMAHTSPLLYTNMHSHSCDNTFLRGG